MRVRDRTIGVKFWLLWLCWPGSALAHASDQGIVLLLPTGAYISAGVATVVATVLALFVLPERAVRSLFAWRPINPLRLENVQIVTSLLSFVLMGFLVWLGMTGPRDPLSSLMTLGFWTLGWVLVVSLSGLIGNPWAWINPWTGLYRVLGPAPVARLPNLGWWPAIAMMLGFAAFLLADIAPSDPTRLARAVGIYWLVTFAGLLIFGPEWLRRCELGHAILGAYSRLAVFGRAGVGVPGWQIAGRSWGIGAGLFALVLLGAGSFDGINETFWWLARIGVNPLEFPGRSAVVAQNLIGLAAAVLLLIVSFALTLRLGLMLAPSSRGLAQIFGPLALSLLPIALAYHMAHYLTSFLVEIQYVLGALNDPLARGADLLGLAPFRVTTGFFNQIASMRAIWLSQAGLVVLGHVWSVLLAHRMALDLFDGHRRAGLATLPLSLFMIAYTFLGLWLLAAPRGA
ncbi:hypothetical protein E4Z66_08765 [Aliishimia ponticola]|uniref:Fenitrothion hydrolase n=1 Tax=Aliishimia ponticola TaxID=2499833 RepID=A0A4S4NLH2_9RHOB|nr:hypothetical protein [Aliishimia ponticola]THH37020.1 hypothetical protein E4Z66_08765 [Aliishimia ponticola]